MVYIGKKKRTLAGDNTVRCSAVGTLWIRSWKKVPANHPSALKHTSLLRVSIFIDKLSRGIANRRLSTTCRYRTVKRSTFPADIPSEQSGRVNLKKTGHRRGAMLRSGMK